MLPLHPHGRHVEIRALIAADVPRLRLKTVPTISRLPAGKKRNKIVVQSEGIRPVRQSTPPGHIHFHDGSFLSIIETWSVPAGDLLSYSYHYQQRSMFVRFDMDERKRPKFPQYHVHYSPLDKLHVPCGGRVELAEVFDMILKQLLPKSV